MKINFLTTCIVFLCYFVTTAQSVNYDFDDYKPIMSSGSIPEDFTTITLDKIESEERIDGLSRSQSNELIKNMHREIDDILKSGRVTYGDPLSAYVTKVGNKLIGNNPDLKHIRFICCGRMSLMLYLQNKELYL